MERHSQPSVQLWALLNSLKPGMACRVPCSLIDEAAVDDEPAIFRVPRPDMTKRYVQKLEEDWGVKLIERFETNHWDIVRPREPLLP